ncbi:MAG: NUMOD4 domain-containing protein [Clostridiales bacterium]|nr:NUMOD4 domain-containing protein [Clostridiales bacterium]
MDNQQLSSKTEWREVKEYSNYEVNQLGEIRHKKRQKILKPRDNNGGYQYVNFKINGKNTNFAVHRIVANAFIPNPNGYTEVNHKDYNKKNNCVDNLEWVSSSQNKQHSYLKQENKKSRGKAVNQYTKGGIFLKTFDSVSDAAKELGCCVAAISNCCLGRTKTSQGFRWSFVESSTTKYERKPSSSVQGSLKEDEDIV